MNKARSHGVEISVDWRPQPSIRLQAALSQFAMKTKDRTMFRGSTSRGTCPNGRATCMSRGIRARIPISMPRYGVGRLSEVTFGLEIPRYTELDLRLALASSQNVEVAVSGRNLLNKRHPEFASELLDVPRCRSSARYSDRFT
ncbi:MAG: TonB-dependent receptor [Betaproteobacteria bacterium]|nr:TonB-dependent receptor [Betaproteobacteria bacterium]